MQWMDDNDTECAMAHYECHNCGITATVVVTAVSELAWLDHMQIHMQCTNYSCWSWTVLKLFP